MGARIMAFLWSVLLEYGAQSDLGVCFNNVTAGFDSSLDRRLVFGRMER